MDEFYLPEDIAEWLCQKKSEYLSKIIENATPDDFQFEQYAAFDEQIPQTLMNPDWSWEKIEDGQRVKTFCRSFRAQELIYQVVVGALIADQQKMDVFVPILSFVSRKENLVKIFSENHTLKRPLLN
jgi:hypothetical protein